MAIEIKELIIRAVVDVKSTRTTETSVGNSKGDQTKDYLESIVNQMKNTNER